MQFTPFAEKSPPVPGTILTPGKRAANRPGSRVSADRALESARVVVVPSVIARKCGDARFTLRKMTKPPVEPTGGERWVAQRATKLIQVWAKSLTSSSQGTEPDDR